MRIIGDSNGSGINHSDWRNSLEADRHARMLEDIYIDADQLDPVTCPPDRRFFIGDKEAWIYDHGNICELVFVRRPEF
jgi:hypothetical protein